MNFAQYQDFKDFCQRNKLDAQAALEFLFSKLRERIYKEGEKNEKLTGRKKHGVD